VRRVPLVRSSSVSTAVTKLSGPNCALSTASTVFAVRTRSIPARRALR
jgi:hypothetical protein